MIAPENYQWKQNNLFSIETVSILEVDPQF